MCEAHTLLIADDHVLFRQGINALLRDYADLLVVGEAANGTEALERSRALRPDVALIDAQLPATDGFQTARQIRDEVPKTRVILLTVQDDSPELVFAAVRAGAMGYVSKTSEIGELVTAIRQVASGQASMAAGSLTNLVSILGSPDLSDRADHHSRQEPLSGREEEVLDLVAQGHSNREMAAILCISESTVRSHLHNILQKLHLSNRVQAATYALSYTRQSASDLSTSGRPEVRRSRGETARASQYRPSLPLVISARAADDARGVEAARLSAGLARGVPARRQPA